jgi:hypothetical protein
MNIIKKLLGEGYPKLGSEVFADGNKTVVTVSRTLSLDHVDADGKFNSINDLRHLAFIARGISEVAKDKLSEPNVIKAIGLDCKPFICTDDESEEAQANA